MVFARSPLPRIRPEEALPGRPSPLPGIPDRHEVLAAPLHPPFGEGVEVVYVAMGCFWGAERIMWRLPGVVSTAVGYAGGFTPNPTYEETCTGRTGHTESVLVAYDPARLPVEHVLATFWENHDPTTPNRQGNDVGTQYRSAIYWTTPGQREAAFATRDAFAAELARHGHGAPTTELRPFVAVAGDDEAATPAGPFYYAEGYHQQYLHKFPRGYCNHGPNGLTCPTGLVPPAS